MEISMGVERKEFFLIQFQVAGSNAWNDTEFRSSQRAKIDRRLASERQNQPHVTWRIVHRMIQDEVVS